MKNKVLILASLLMTFNSFAQWNWLNPKPQGNNLNAVFFVNGSTGYAAGHHGTIVKSTDSGDSWDVVFHRDFLELNDIYFSDVLTGFSVGKDIESNKGIILKTNNAGITWTTVYDSQVFLFNSISFTGVDTGYVSGSDGIILRTEDGGDTWVTLSTGINENLTSIYFTDSDNGYVVGGNGIILKTVNAGLEWLPLISGKNTLLNSVFFTNSNTGYVVGAFGTMLKTDNAGATWQAIELGSASTNFISLHFSDPSTGFVVATGRLLFKTVDAGETWFEVLEQEYIKDVFFAGTTDGYAIGWAGQFFKSTDAGETWSKFRQQTHQGDNTKIFFVDASTGYVINTQYYIDKSTILKTVDGGIYWDTINMGVQGLFHDICFIDGNIGFVTGMISSQSVLLRTIDSGETWQIVPTGNHGTLGRIKFADSNTGFISVNYDGFLKTTDAGESWAFMPVGVGDGFQAFDFTNVNVGYLLKETPWQGSELYKTSDGAITWIKVHEWIYDQLSLVYFIDSLTGFVSHFYNGLYKTIDGGVTWSEWIDLNQYIYLTKSILFTDANTGFISGGSNFSNGGAVIKTIDGGLTWSPTLNIAPGWLNSLSFPEPGIGFVAGENGSILSTSNGGGSVDVGQVTTNKELFYVYPNPAKDYITFESINSAKGLITISDICGKTVYEVPLSGNSIRIETGSLNAGVYIYSFKGSTIYSSGKMLILK